MNFDDLIGNRKPKNITADYVEIYRSERGAREAGEEASSLYRKERRREVIRKVGSSITSGIQRLGQYQAGLRQQYGPEARLRSLQQEAKELKIRAQIAKKKAEIKKYSGGSSHHGHDIDDVNYAYWGPAGNPWAKK